MKRSHFRPATAVLAVVFASGSGYGQTNPVHAGDAAQVQARLARDEKILQDWANLNRYRAENSQLPSPGETENRVVFMGDSITDAWGRSRGVFFPGKPYINRGISGQTTPQMLVRFHPDVIALRPKVVLILAGTNDIAGNTGPESLEDIEGNLQSMAELANANGIKVILASVMPVCDYIKPQTPARPPDKILTLNAWMRSYCATHHLTYLDYYSALIDDNKMFRKGLTYDGLHPNDAGYAVMSPLAAQAIEAALAGDNR
jgi:lysophospholipase L1-like esterase